MSSKRILNIIAKLTNPLIRRIAHITTILNHNRIQKAERLSDQDLIKRMENDRALLLQIWGIEDNEAEINKVNKGLKIEAYLFTFLSVIPVFSLFTDVKAFMYWLALLTFSPLCLLIASTRLWRIECLSEGRLISYSKWLSGGMYD